MDFNFPFNAKEIRANSSRDVSERCML